MPRTPAHTKDQLIEAAMHHFWQFGFEATSMDDLVKATGLSRHGIYNQVGNKQALYLSCFEAYQHLVVAPAVERLEAHTTGLSDIQHYFETQIAMAEQVGLPGPGCFVANAMTETAPHDKYVAAKVAFHNTRLQKAFLNGLRSAEPQLSLKEHKNLAQFLMITAQGLWSMSRTTSKAAPLRQYVSTLMKLLKGKVTS